MTERLKKAGVSATALFIAAMLSVCLVPTTGAFAADGVTTAAVSAAEENESSDGATGTEAEQGAIGNSKGGSASAGDSAADEENAADEEGSGAEGAVGEEGADESGTVKLVDATVTLSKTDSGWKSDLVQLAGVSGALALADGADGFTLLNANGDEASAVNADEGFYLVYAGDEFAEEAALSFTLTGDDGELPAELTVALASESATGSDSETEVVGTDDQAENETADSSKTSGSKSGKSSKPGKSSSSSSATEEETEENAVVNETADASTSESADSSKSSKASSGKSSSKSSGKTKSSSSSGKSSKSSGSSSGKSSSKQSSSKSKQSGGSTDGEDESSSSSKSYSSSKPSSSDREGKVSSDASDQSAANESDEATSTDIGEEPSPVTPTIAVSTIALLGAAGVANAARFK